MEVLTERYGHGRLCPGPGSPDHLRYRYWLHYAEGSFMPLMVMKLIFGQLAPKSPAVARPLMRMVDKKVNAMFLGPQIDLHLDYLEAELEKSEWFAGNQLTAADIQMSFPLEAASARAGFGTRRPRLQAMLDKMQARPAYQQALAKGGPYQLLG